MPNPFAGHQMCSPSLRLNRAEEIALEYFGVEATASPLASHQDQNFHIDAGERSYVLRVANRRFTDEELALQNQIMSHLHGRLRVDVPQVCRARDDNLMVQVDDHSVRLLTYIDGEPLNEFAFLAAPVLRAVGWLTADTVAALQSFEWFAGDRMLQWDLRHAVDVVAALAPELSDRTRAELAQRVIEVADRLLKPRVASLPTQVIHGDIIDWNIICRRRDDGRPAPVGLIDFGDVTHSYRAGEVAVAATACICHRPDSPLETVVEVTRAFHEHVPLIDDELDAVWPLVLARAASAAVSTAQQLELDAANPYLAESGGNEWLTLELVAAIPPALARAALRRRCGMRPWPAIERARRRLNEIARDAAAPIVPEAGRMATVDLSPTSAALIEGQWETAEDVREAIASQAQGAVAVGRWGEARLIHATRDCALELPTVHLGVDIFVREGCEVRAPCKGVISRQREDELLVDLAGVRLRVAHINPAADRGREVGRGEILGTVAAPREGDRLPAHVHLQLVTEDIEAVPGLATASQRDAWLWLCPDPSGLLGVTARADAPSAAQLRAERSAHVASPQVHYYEEPPFIERGWRQYLYDGDGRAYVDVVNNVAVIGHSHPAVARAATRQLRLLNTNSRFLYGSMSRFARRLADLVPDPLDVVFLVNSGSEANDLALRLVRHATGAKDTLCVEGTYHGWTTATLEVSTGLFENPAAAEQRPDWVHPVPMPNTFRGPYRGLDAGQRYAEDASRVIERLKRNGRRPAALIAESLMGYEGGMLPPPGYTRAVVELVRAAGGMFIADEVQVGYGRIGQHFWAFEHEGVVPDVVTIAKSTGNGHPVGAVITRREIAERFGDCASWFSSVGGGPVSCEVGLAVLDVVEHERLQENARNVGEHLARRLRDVVGRHEIAGAIHGMGLYLGLELVRDRATLEPATAETYAICERMRDLGVIVQPTGNHENILKIKPPLVISRGSADFFVDQLDRVLEDGW